MSERKDRVEVFEDAAGGFSWHRLAPNGEIISDSGESYRVKSHALDAAKRANGKDVDYEVEEPEGRDGR